MSTEWIDATKQQPEARLEKDELIYPYVLIYSDWHDPYWGIAFYSTEDGQWYLEEDYPIDTVQWWKPLDTPRKD